MASPTYIGSTGFRTSSVEETENSEGVDTLQVTLQGDLDSVDAESALWTRGRSGSSLGYPNMYLQTKSVLTGGNQPFATISLEFAGFLASTLANPIGKDDSLTIQSGSFVTDQVDDDGNQVIVQASFYAQQTTFTWIHRGVNAPLSPQYPAVVPSEINTGTLFNKFPPTYPGTIQVKNVGLLAAFNRSELATGVWAVSETWIVRMEPDS